LFQNIEKAPLKLPSSLSTDAKSLLKAVKLTLTLIFSYFVFHSYCKEIQPKDWDLEKETLKK